MKSDERVAIVTETCNVEETKQPFGKRWGQERVFLTMQHINALQEGKIIALDVQGEYVMFIELEKVVEAKHD